MRDYPATFKVFDTKEKIYLTEGFQHFEDAESEKDRQLTSGLYPDDPHTVLEIHEFEGEKFIQDVTNGY